MLKPAEYSNCKQTDFEQTPSHMSSEPAVSWAVAARCTCTPIGYCSDKSLEMLVPAVALPDLASFV